MENFRFKFWIFVQLLAILGDSLAELQNSDLNEFRYCLRQSQHPGLKDCIGRSAISWLQRFDDQDNATLFGEGLTSRKSDKLNARSIVNLMDTTDPIDFRGILENAGAVFSQRSLEWHMDGFYPGLMFKIGPTGDTNSLAEFVIDPAISERNFAYDEPSTARVLTRQYLLPFLLGLKFNLVALVPLLFAGIFLLLKKSLFLVKLAVYVSSLLGVGSTIGTLGGFAGLGGPGGLGGFGGPAGPGGLGGLGFGGFGFGGGPSLLGLRDAPAVHAATHAHPHHGALNTNKSPLYHHYGGELDDDLQHNSPYKRNDRKVVKFDSKPRDYEFVTVRPKTATTTPATDHFYDYEKKLLMQDNIGEKRSATGNQPAGTKLRPSPFDPFRGDDGGIGVITSAVGGQSADDDLNYNTNERPGWKVVDGRV